jgi:D-sedoheptulose 7-phosphate isomerase
MNFKIYAANFNDTLQHVNPQEIANCVSLLKEAYYNNKHVFIFGNGGSGANASHICEDLSKGILHDFKNQKRLKVMSLTDNTPAILAWANDNGYENIFVEQMKNFAEHGDVAIGLSGSGNSQNVIKAIEYANEIGMQTIGCTGYDGGRLKQIARYGLHAPSFNMGTVEAIHLVIFHHIIETLYSQFKSLLDITQ